MKRKFFIGAFLVVAAAALFIPQRRIGTPLAAASIPATGGASLQINLVRDAAYFLQTDERWKDERLGGSNEKLASVGCTLCSVAMALDGLDIHTTPPDLNRQLIARSGYTEQGLLVWSKIADITAGRAEVVVCPTPSHAEMDDCLKNGAYPIIKIALPRGVSHWVVVVGKDGFEYLIKDPLLADRQIVKLSTRTQSIEALRCVCKSGAKQNN